jgi:hypothetical protein
MPSIQKKKKSLGEQLAELANPSPKDFDPDAFESRDAALSENEGSDMDDENDLVKEHYLEVG